MADKKKTKRIKVDSVEEEIELETEEDSDSGSFRSIFFELLPYAIILIVVVLIRTFIVTPVIVSGPSMNPTLDGGELMILNKLGKIDRYDIVVVDAGEDDIIKRVIGMPGEKIQCQNNNIYINGYIQEEDYSIGNTCPIKEKWFEYELADDEYFVMGDNRENSSDSRHIGPVKQKKIKGTTSLILYPFKKIGTIE